MVNILEDRGRVRVHKENPTYYFLEKPGGMYAIYLTDSVLDLRRVFHDLSYGAILSDTILRMEMEKQGLISIRPKIIYAWTKLDENVVRIEYVSKEGNIAKIERVMQQNPNFDFSTRPGPKNPYEISLDLDENLVRVVSGSGCPRDIDWAKTWNMYRDLLSPNNMSLTDGDVSSHRFIPSGE